MKETEQTALHSAAAAQKRRVQEEQLNTTWKNGHIPAFTQALSAIAKAQGMAETASKAGISRQALYKALSDKGNPSLSTLMGIMKALGIQAIFHPTAEGAKQKSH